MMIIFTVVVMKSVRPVATRECNHSERTVWFVRLPPVSPVRPIEQFVGESSKCKLTPFKFRTEQYFHYERSRTIENIFINKYKKRKESKKKSQNQLQTNHADRT